MHCVLAGDRFRPHWFSSDRAYHREFWDWLPVEVHERHLSWSQEIARDCFGVPVVTFVPPGNVFTPATLVIARCCRLRYVSYDTPPGWIKGMHVVGNRGGIPFHDRDIVLGGAVWLARPITTRAAAAHCAVADLVAEGESGYDAQADVSRR
jgi:peptidoglycan/xylan/chitin deacetylase (PgdA/CDA1 family)